MEGVEIINKEEFENLAREWTALDTEYDNLFQAFLNNPGVKTPNELERFKTLQQRLYSIELKLYKVAEGKIFIKYDKIILYQLI